MTIQSIAVCGAGTMGSGIAQVAAQSGFYTILFDLNEAILQKARLSIFNNLEKMEAKKKITSIEKDAIFNKIKFITDSNDCIADVIIEAIVESPDAKVNLFNQLAEVNHSETIFASNTSSISITAIQKRVTQPSRVVGMHFFNPAPIMKLVEIVKGELTSDEVANTVYNFAVELGKTPVMCKDAPGFIVNRIARPYYLEAMHLVEQGAAAIEDIDKLMESTGFKMGPFKLMDLIGLDINLAVSRSIFEAYNKAERFTPSKIQVDKVDKGELGRKSGKGFYKY